ncbi:MAG: Coenzyme F420 hydrogenase/dehydrogenase, beta subunit C-terminal domain [Ruminococcus flavefaciens]|nr:Coenzyme F420 hydrogenase/dehydrogenase, beta subunit C-terminal domain [Ruminococcus flavefaciens]
MKNIVLLDNNKKCCACGSCVNICPKNAISMKADSLGFIYPNIDRNKCIECMKCIKSCNFQHGENGNEPLKVYAASARNDKILKSSSSGGAFSVFAKKILSEKGVVFGCAMERCNEKFSVHHIMIDSLKDLPKLQGSKYTMSNTEYVFREVLSQLKTGRKVLFSGTPCQIDGLLGYLGNKKYDNLITVDIICHGVPSEKMFQDYISMEERKSKMSVLRFYFRSKQYGWGSYVSKEYRKNNNGKKVVLTRFARRSSYYWLFLNSVSCRENCYTCKYADKKRVSDITIGDYWGIEKVHPKLVNESGTFDMKKGISCILINSEKGDNFLNQCADNMNLEESDFESVALRNGQLNSPTVLHPKRDLIMNLYHKNGYDAVDRWYKKYLGIKRYIYVLWDFIPFNFRSRLKKLFKP